MAGPKSSSPKFISRRKFGIATIAVLLLVLFGFFIRERYFYRADVLIAIQTDVTRSEKVLIEDQVKTEESGLLSYFGFGGKSNDKQKRAKKKLNIWDEWMMKQKKMTSIGDIYDKCGELIVPIYSMLTLRINALSFNKLLSREKFSDRIF